MNNSLIKNSLNNTISYATYRNLIKKLIAEGKSTGIDQSEDHLTFSILNDKRMDRLDKTLKISEETQNSLNKLNREFTFLVIAEGWCGDAAQILPIINKVAEASDKIDFKIVLRDENEDLMNQFLTNGSKSIPKALILDRENNLLDSWGPRPGVASKMVVDYKAQNGSLDEEFKKNLQIWYNNDKGNNIQNELLSMLHAN
ncbi:MAG: thioredoxin family protein [Lutibacter sp.]|nr:thioredoxin family protein [Lutibacter sp.]MDP3945662.1 thioredoxin family protein [Lutibacter sp.]